jgi:hypothetical protein
VYIWKTDDEHHRVCSYEYARDTKSADRGRTNICRREGQFKKKKKRYLLNRIGELDGYISPISNNYSRARSLRVYTFTHIYRCSMSGTKKKKDCVIMLHYPPNYLACHRRRSSTDEKTGKEYGKSNARSSINRRIHTRRHYPTIPVRGTRVTRTGGERVTSYFRILYTPRGR